MKKFLFFFLILIVIMAFHISASASSIQKPALWPAIYDIKPANDGGYIFTVKVRAYCPEGIEGNLLVAAYDDTNRLLDVKYCGLITISPFELDGNCPKADFLEKTSLATDQDNTLSVDLELEDKNKAIIKAFVIDFDTLKPEIESGKIVYNYNNGDSYVDVDYILKSDYKNEQIDANRYYYYYYYYDGNCTKVDVSFVKECLFSTKNRFYFLYYDSNFDIQEDKIYEDDDLSGQTITFDTLSGIKIANHITYPYTDYLNKFGFETNGIKIYCDFGEI